MNLIREREAEACADNDWLYSRFTIQESRLQEHNVEAEIWVRGEQNATTEIVASWSASRAPGPKQDVTEVLAGMFRAIDRAKNPDTDADRPVALRGFSWIVNPFENGGVVIAIEMSLGAIVAGPFDIAEHDLTAMINRVMAAERGPEPHPATETIH